MKQSRSDVERSGRPWVALQLSTKATIRNFRPNCYFKFKMKSLDVCSYFSGPCIENCVSLICKAFNITNRWPCCFVRILGERIVGLSLLLLVSSLDSRPGDHPAQLPAKAENALIFHLSWYILGLLPTFLFSGSRKVCSAPCVVML